MNIQRKYGCTITQLRATAAMVIGVLGFAGCSPGITIGGYRHVDMSRSHYRTMIREKADKLAESQRPRDKRLAAELYGSIRELDLMDKCIAGYFEKEPSMGVYLLMRGNKIHKYYRSPP